MLQIDDKNSIFCEKGRRASRPLFYCIDLSSRGSSWFYEISKFTIFYRGVNAVKIRLIPTDIIHVGWH